MILGLESPALFPVKDIYDSGMIEGLINDARRDYEQAVADRKEFNKTFGDFYSPSSVDMQNWYNFTQRPIQEFLDKNPDAIRSREGRAQLARLQNQIATNPNLPIMRANSASLAERIKAENALRASGQTVLPDGVDARNWDSSRDGMFLSTSPTAVKSLDELLKPTIETLKKEYRPDHDLIAKNPGWWIETVDPARIQEQMGTTLGELKSSPYWEYLKSIYNTDDEGLVKKAIEHVDNSIGQDWKKDDVYWARKKDELDRAEFAETKRHNRATEAGAKKDGDGGYSPRYQSFIDGLARIGHTDTSMTVGTQNYAKSVADKGIKSVMKNWDKWLANQKTKYKNDPKKLKAAQDKYNNERSKQYNRIYTEATVSYKRREQERVMRQYKGSNTSSSYALAYGGDENEIKRRIGGGYLVENGAGFKLDASNRHNLLSIQQVTGRTGYVKAVDKNAPSTIDRVYFSDGQDNMITQYEPRDNKYHQYFKVHDASGKSYWYDSGYVDYTSGQAQGADSGTLYDMHQKTGSIGSPLNESQVK